MKNKNGSCSVVTILSAAQKPFVAVEASPPCATAMLFRHSLSQRLSPTHRGGVLSADAAATRQHASAFFPRHVEHHADVPALAHAPDSHHGRGKGLLERQSQ